MFEYFIVGVIIIIAAVSGLISRGSDVITGGGRKHHRRYNHEFIYDVFDENVLPVENLRLGPDWRRLGRKEIALRRKVDFIFSMAMVTKWLDATPARLKHRLESIEITDKVRFHEHAQAMYPAAVARTFEVGPDTEIDDVYMIRANWGWMGKASAVATNTAELQALYEQFMTKPADYKFSWDPRVIASEYIKDPVLFNGCKFHTRVHVLLVRHGPRAVLRRERDAAYTPGAHARVGGIYGVILPSIEIIPAGKPYVKGDWNDLEVHDSHDANNPVHGILEDMPDTGRLRAAVYEAIVNCIRPMLSMVTLYDEADSAYQIFGADVMYTYPDGEAAPPRAIILEFNKTPGLSGTKAIMTPIRGDVCRAIMATGFSDLFEGYTADTSDFVYFTDI